MPTLNWIGKEKVINHHLDVPYKVLDYKYTYENKSNTSNKQSENKIIHGDNLEALKSLLPQYEGKVDCIYIDPPYNTGNESWVYNDNVNDPKIKKWLGDVVGKEGEDLSRHDKWLCMMYPRLKLLQRLLADTGAIFISIDDNEQANLKLLCDEIFGHNNAIGPIILNKLNAKNDTIDTQKNHEFILAYRKKEIVVNGRTEPTLIRKEIKPKKVFHDNDGYYYLNDSITTRGEGGVLSARPNLGYTIYYNPNTKQKLARMDYDLELAIESNNEEKVYSNDMELIRDGFIALRPPRVRNALGCWTWSLEKFKNENVNIIIIETRNGYSVRKRTFVEKKKIYKEKDQFYIDDYTESNSRSIMEFSTNEGTKEFKKAVNSEVQFDNPKNVSLLSYLIGLIRNKNAVILDSFAGSGTTAHAVLNLNKEDGGNRKFILIEMEDYAETITAERVRRVINGYGDTDGTGGDFNYYTLGAPLLIDNKYINEDVPLKILREYIFFTETSQVLPVLSTSENPYLLGSHNLTDYYFYYEKESLTTLDDSFLGTIKQAAESYLIYADICTLSDTELLKHGIIFKKIPRDITKI